MFHSWKAQFAFHGLVVPLLFYKLKIMVNFPPGDHIFSGFKYWQTWCRSAQACGRGSIFFVIFSPVLNEKIVLKPLFLNLSCCFVTDRTQLSFCSWSLVTTEMIFFSVLLRASHGATLTFALSFELGCDASSFESHSSAQLPPLML